MCIYTSHGATNLPTCNQIFQNHSPYYTLERNKKTHEIVLVLKSYKFIFAICTFRIFHNHTNLFLRFAPFASFTSVFYPLFFKICFLVPLRLSSFILHLSTALATLQESIQTTVMSINLVCAHEVSRSA